MKRMWNQTGGPLSNLTAADFDVAAKKTGIKVTAHSGKHTATSEMVTLAAAKKLDPTLITIMCRHKSGQVNMGLGQMTVRYTRDATGREMLARIMRTEEATGQLATMTVDFTTPALRK